jgi:SagB-type dehydrogenase family enzyme
VDGVPLATLAPVSASFQPTPADVVAGQPYSLSPFAYTRVQDGQTVLESPLSHARVVLHDWRATAVVHLLARPRGVASLPAEISGLPLAAATSLIGILLAARMVGTPTAHGTSVEDSPALRSWEFHDLVFHARSRAGRHDGPIGGTYRLVGEMEPAPTLKSVACERWVDLYRPDLARLEQEDPPFARVQEARRSIREYGDPPISDRQLGEFLYRVGRVADYLVANLPTPRGFLRMDFAPRPYPAGGTLYELELYVVVGACVGLDAGLYYYHPERHRLGVLPAAAEDVEALLQDAAWSTMMPRERLQVVLVVSARFPRIAWKYSGIAYSLILKHVGVLYQTMYLAATAMGLAPCGVGAGDADLFARAAGTDYYAETSVGEFLLGSRP